MHLVVQRGASFSWKAAICDPWLKLFSPVQPMEQIVCNLIPFYEYICLPFLYCLLFIIGFVLSIFALTIIRANAVRNKRPPCAAAEGKVPFSFLCACKTGPAPVCSRTPSPIESGEKRAGSTLSAEGGSLRCKCRRTPARIRIKLLL